MPLLLFGNGSTANSWSAVSDTGGDRDLRQLLRRADILRRLRRAVLHLPLVRMEPDAQAFTYGGDYPGRQQGLRPGPPVQTNRELRQPRRRISPVLLDRAQVEPPTQTRISSTWGKTKAARSPWAAFDLSKEPRLAWRRARAFSLHRGDGPRAAAVQLERQA